MSLVNMIPSRFFVLFALAVFANAQSAPDFPVQVSTNLRVDFQSSSTSVNPAGVLISRDDVLAAPTIDGPTDSSRTLDFMIFMVDQDATSPDDANTRVQFLQWYQPNLGGASEVLSDFGTDAQNFTSAPAVSYMPPTPPAGDEAHRYTLLLYSQPEGFSIPASFESFFDSTDSNARISFDMAGFAAAAGIGQPVAANWFEVQNTSQAVTSSTAATSSTTASSTSASTSTSTSTTISASTSSTTSTSTFNSSSISTQSFVSNTTMTVATVTASATASDLTSQTPAGPSTMTVVTTAGIPTTTASASAGASTQPSASASGSLASGSGACMVDVRDSMSRLVVALVFGVAGAGLWLL
ncbi:uncharacterized protein Z520_03665 [Fonsecaea multimorphosa CBS 102226]|uniref:Phosphatidylethanolamine-binding protein n=1 Tax=Fonsecaea multimorphosa CBS 102226 TaxID=1442371 RepID=A0A0D2KW69_9EURO|nr:uncharacterized protein Z520_03665 [Fonsecaea multimorphosa CBS 102226]KIY00999.1 hypothetical protein Z520_03665 [Fonsecaea multimorphosa CBS 102226]OAL27584.1 hypothetical protein AYO22_03488 [Fonsecaea multimorphosa]